MKVEKKAWTIEVNEDEIRLIAYALNASKKNAEIVKDSDAICAYRRLRNDFSDLIGLHYMGADA